MEGPGCFSPQRTASNELLFGIQLLSYPMGLKKQPTKPSINPDQMTGLGAYLRRDSTDWLVCIFSVAPAVHVTDS